MRDWELEHPDITSALRTGYPSWDQPESVFCGECGKCIDDETVYGDRYYENLCENCLLVLHRKW